LKLTVIVPAYNEEKRLPETIRKLKAVLPLNTELIVSDDGSSDSTVDLARSLGCKTCISFKNTGKSGAVARGVSSATGEAILVCDADLPVPEADITALLKIYTENTCDMVIASRYIKGAVVRRRPLRALAGRLFSWYVRLLFRLPFYDTQCGVKLFKAGSTGRLFPLLTETGYLFDIELLALSHQAGLKVVEFPVTWEDKPGSKVSLARDARKMFFGALYLKNRLSRRLPVQASSVGEEG
jgi:dolichyl-phosphate beta-glucosyltransferase